MLTCLIPAVHPFPTGVRSGSGIPLASIANANAGFTKI